MKVKGTEHAERDDYLLSAHGRFDIKNGMKEEVQFDFSIPDYSTQFQINRRFYVCGGQSKIN